MPKDGKLEGGGSGKDVLRVAGAWLALCLMIVAFSIFMVVGMACHPLTYAFVSGAPECPIPVPDSWR